jgi:hypothetical protein
MWCVGGGGFALKNVVIQNLSLREKLEQCTFFKVTRKYMWGLLHNTQSS